MFSYDVKNYADLGSCDLPLPITFSSICIILHIVLSLIQYYCQLSFFVCGTTPGAGGAHVKTATCY